MRVQEFYEREWKDLTERTRRTAEHFAEQSSAAGELRQAAETFAAQAPPSTYAEFLARCREAANLAVEWRNEAQPAAAATAE